MAYSRQSSALYANSVSSSSSRNYIQSGQGTYDDDDEDDFNDLDIPSSSVLRNKLENFKTDKVFNKKPINISKKDGISPLKLTSKPSTKKTDYLNKYREDVDNELDDGLDYKDVDCGNGFITVKSNYDSVEKDSFMKAFNKEKLKSEISNLPDNVDFNKYLLLRKSQLLESMDPSKTLRISSGLPKLKSSNETNSNDFHPYTISEFNMKNSKSIGSAKSFFLSSSSREILKNLGGQHKIIYPGAATQNDSSKKAKSIHDSFNNTSIEKFENQFKTMPSLAFNDNMRSGSKTNNVKSNIVTLNWEEPLTTKEKKVLKQSPSKTSRSSSKSRSILDEGDNDLYDTIKLKSLQKIDGNALKPIKKTIQKDTAPMKSNKRVVSSLDTDDLDLDLDFDDINEKLSNSKIKSGKQSQSISTKKVNDSMLSLNKSSKSGMKTITFINPDVDPSTLHSLLLSKDASSLSIKKEIKPSKVGSSSSTPNDLQKKISLKSGKISTSNKLKSVNAEQNGVPMLIRPSSKNNIGPGNVSGMKYNPEKQIWEGNEDIMDDFDIDAINTVIKKPPTVRPTLITNMAYLNVDAGDLVIDASTLIRSLSPSNAESVKKPTKSSMTSKSILKQPLSNESVNKISMTKTNSNTSSKTSNSTVKGIVGKDVEGSRSKRHVVGGMIFDPVKMCWIGNEEEEEDIFAGIEDDYGPDHEDLIGKKSNISSPISKNTEYALDGELNINNDNSKNHKSLKKSNNIDSSNRGNYNHRLNYENGVMGGEDEDYENKSVLSESNQLPKEFNVDRETTEYIYISDASHKLFMGKWFPSAIIESRNMNKTSNLCISKGNGTNPPQRINNLHEIRYYALKYYSNNNKAPSGIN